MNLSKRNNFIANNIIFLDGISGSGKTMLSPILSSFNRVEVGIFDSRIENINILDKLDLIQNDVAEHIINIYADITSYETHIGRGTNFRLHDLSGVFNNPKSIKNIKRALSKYNSEDILKEIADEGSYSLINTHQIIGAIDLSIRTFSERLKVIEVVRHPLYVIENWHYSYKFCMPGEDPRDFLIRLSYGDNSVPWFAKGWEDKFIKSNVMDKVIYSLDSLYSEVYNKIDNPELMLNSKLLAIPFEKFVLNTDYWIGKMSDFLGEPINKQIYREAAKQKCPRKLVTDGVAKDIYKKYGWSKPEISEKHVYNKKLDFAQSHASKEGLKVLNKICIEYEERFGHWF